MPSADMYAAVLIVGEGRTVYTLLLCAQCATTLDARQPPADQRAIS